MQMVMYTIFSLSVQPPDFCCSWQKLNNYWFSVFIVTKRNEERSCINVSVCLFDGHVADYKMEFLTVFFSLSQRCIVVVNEQAG